MASKAEELAERGVVRALSSEFEHVFAAELIEQCVVETWSSFSDARIREFIPLLAYRIARDRLLDVQPSAPARERSPV